MIIDYFHVFGISAGPNETDTPSIVDPDAPLPGPITFQGFQMIPRGNPQSFDFCRGGNHIELAKRDSQERTKAFRIAAFVQFLSFLIRKRF